MADADFDFEVLGAGRLARILLSAADRLDDELWGEMRGLGEDAELVFQSHAPTGLTGRLGRGIRAVPVGDRIIVRADARNQFTGYDYVGVTRFGHREARIYPDPNRAPASVIAKRGEAHVSRATGARATLRFVIGGRVLFRRSVKGYRPGSDWAADAMPDIREEAKAVATRLGRKIEVLAS